MPKIFYYAIAFLLLSAAIVLAAPAFSSWDTYNNNSQYNPTATYGIQVTVLEGGAAGNISSVRFTSNISGTQRSYERNANGNSNWTTFNNTTAGVWYINFTVGQTAGAGTYTYTWWANNTTGSTTTDTTRTFVIQQNASNPVNLYLNGNLNQNVSISYGTESTATGTATAGAALYRDGIAVTNSEVATLPVGTYAYKVNATGNTNYSANASGLTYYLIVGSLSGGSSCTAASQCSAGYCVHGICRSTSTYCGDGYCDGEHSYCVADCGVGLAKTWVTTERGKATITIPSIAANSMATVEIEKAEDLAMRQISISVTNKVNSVAIKIVKLDAKPTELEKPSDKVYHYIEITKANVRDQDISSAKLKFAVSKSWLSGNSVGNVAFYRIENNSWAKYSATKVSETSDESIYEASTPGLSVFAIGADTLALPTTSSPGQLPTGTDLTILYIILALVIIGVLVYFFFLKKKV